MPNLRKLAEAAPKYGFGSFIGVKADVVLRLLDALRAHHKILRMLNRDQFGKAAEGHFVVDELLFNVSTLLAELDPEDDDESTRLRQPY